AALVRHPPAGRRAAPPRPPPRAPPPRLGALGGRRGAHPPADPPLPPRLRGPRTHLKRVIHEGHEGPRRKEKGERGVSPSRSPFSFLRGPSCPSWMNPTPGPAGAW